jgi:hypothetical protein
MQESEKLERWLTSTEREAPDADSIQATSNNVDTPGHEV